MFSPLHSTPMYPLRHSSQKVPAQWPRPSSLKQSHVPVFWSHAPLSLHGQSSVQNGPQ